MFLETSLHSYFSFMGGIGLGLYSGYCIFVTLQLDSVINKPQYTYCSCVCLFNMLLLTYLYTHEHKGMHQNQVKYQHGMATADVGKQYIGL